MPFASPSPRRARLALLGSSLIALGFVLWFIRTEDPVQGNEAPAAHVAAPWSDVNAPDPFAFDAPEDRSNPPEPTRPGEQLAPRSGVNDATDAEHRRHRAWDLVAQLEQLSRSPETFHSLALPVIEQLTDVCADDARSENAAISERAYANRPVVNGADPRTLVDRRPIASTLLGDVVGSSTRSPLVRGAVFLALATELSEAEFWDNFDLWLAGDASTPLELVRAAALASTRRGTPTPCEDPLSLKQLAALPTRGGVTLPGFYTLTLTELAPEHAHAAIRAWLDAPDPRRALFQRNARAPSQDDDMQSVAEYFTTSEILFCIFGHHALLQPSVERRVLHEALLLEEPGKDHSLVCFRAASFVVHALSMCNDTLLAAAGRAESSSDAMVSSLARLMGETAVGGLNDGLVGRIERLRYSAELSDEADLVLLLMELGESFGDVYPENSERRTFAMEYLEGLTLDSAVVETARASALTAMLASATWEELGGISRSVLTRGDTALLNSIALNALLKHARTQADHRVAVVELLRQLAGEVRGLEARSSIEGFLAELSD